MEQLGRFGHHPDPATDFCVECEVIEGMAYNVTVGLDKREDLEDCLFKAMQFRVGGDEQAVAAKSRLREIEASLRRE